MSQVKINLEHIIQVNENNVTMSLSVYSAVVKNYPRQCKGCSVCQLKISKPLRSVTVNMNAVITVTHG